MGAAPSCAAVLDPWVVTWTSRIVLKPATCTSAAKELLGTTQVEWIRRGRFLETPRRNDEGESGEIQRHDEKSGAYHTWSFDSPLAMRVDSDDGECNGR